MSASDRELLTALLDHSIAPQILDVHLDSCEDDACTGCDPQHLSEKAAAEAGCTCGPQLRCPNGHCSRHYLCQDCGRCCSCKCAAGGAR